VFKVLSARQLRLDDTYQSYVHRVAQLTLTETYKSQLEHIQESPKFKLWEGKRIPSPFPGYTVITPPWCDDSDNTLFYQNLQDCQKRLFEQMEPGLIVPVPRDSFHLTIGDLIWDSAYQDATTKNPDFEEQLRSRVAESFSSCAKSPEPIRWMVLGCMLRTRAIGVCLAPTDQNSFVQTMELRRSLYQNPSLIALGIEQQYNFTAHLTLGYFGSIPSQLDRDNISELLSDLNMEWLDAPQSLGVSRVELRKFDDMTRYYRQDDWPVFEFS
jgi:hypothetical protein